VQVDQINLSGIVERYIVFKTSGSIKERTQMSTEIGAGCQQNGPEMGVGRGDAGEEVCRKGCPYIGQLANYGECSRRVGESLIQGQKWSHFVTTSFPFIISGCTSLALFFRFLKSRDFHLGFKK